MALPKQENDMDRQPFLGKEHHDWDSSDSRSSTVDGDESSPRTQSRRHSLQWAILSHIILILTYTAIFFYLIKPHFNPSNIRPQLTYCETHHQQAIYAPRLVNKSAAPAAGAIEYMTKAVDGLAPDSIYAGDPTPELDDAWHKLLASTRPANPLYARLIKKLTPWPDINLRITPEEMSRLNQTSLALADGSGYLGTLGVYHELHCIVRSPLGSFQRFHERNGRNEPITFGTNTETDPQMVLQRTLLPQHDGPRPAGTLHARRYVFFLFSSSPHPLIP